MLINFWTLFSVLLMSLSILTPISHCFYYCSFLISLEVWYCQSSNLVFSLMLYWLFWVFCLPYNFKISLSVSINNLLGIWLELHQMYRSSWKNSDIFNIFSLFVHEYGKCFHLTSFKKFFVIVWQFPQKLLYRSCTHFFKLIPEYFIFWQKCK